jgi:hypothetical protein
VADRKRSNRSTAGSHETAAEEEAAVTAG